LSFPGGHTSIRDNVNRTTVNLCKLGANRNLVLVNGKRWVPGLGGTTNLQTIPTSIISRSFRMVPRRSTDPMLFQASSTSSLSKTLRLPRCMPTTVSATITRPAPGTGR
jgi:hypothetical protein